MLTLADIANDQFLDVAYIWLCQRRKDWSADADVWRFRQDWSNEKERLRDELLSGTYEVGLLDRVTLCRDGQQEDVDLWSARDAVVMKALSLVLPQHLPLSKQCTHLKGHGGSKFAVRQILESLPDYRCVLKTDVQSYYASIDHQLLLDQLAVHVADRRVMNLMGQYLLRCAERGGLFWEYKKGIALGCPLSPVMGAFFLTELDEELEKLGGFYVRYMDDILVLAPTRWKLRKAVKVVNKVLDSLKLQKHPDKTFIGRVEKGFDFLGYHFRPGKLTVASKTIGQFVVRATRLYEQGADLVRIGKYARRWFAWVNGGICVWGGSYLTREHTALPASPPLARPEAAHIC